jgi:hypothetical protein
VTQASVSAMIFSELTFMMMGSICCEVSMNKCLENASCRP